MVFDGFFRSFKGDTSKGILSKRRTSNGRQSLTRDERRPSYNSMEQREYIPRTFRKAPRVMVLDHNDSFDSRNKFESGSELELARAQKQREIERDVERFLKEQKAEKELEKKNQEGKSKA